MVIARAAPVVYHDTIASLHKGTHGFHGSKRHLASLSSLMGDSPSASSALPAAVYPPGKLGDPPGIPARFSQGRGRRGLTSYRQVCRGPFLWAEALLAPVKDDNAAKGVPECPAGICALVKRRYVPKNQCTLPPGARKQPGSARLLQD